MLETLFGLAREGHVNAKGMPDLLQLALTAQEFSDVIVFRKPSPMAQRVVFGARWDRSHEGVGTVRLTRASRAQRWHPGHRAPWPADDRR